MLMQNKIKKEGSIKMKEIFYGVVTHPGMVREKNEDFYGYLPFEGGIFSIVADGMGGMKGGVIASKLAVETMWSSTTTNLPMSSMLTLVQSVEI